MNEKNSSMDTAKLAQIISQTSLATLLLVALVIFMYLSHQRELTEHQNQRMLFEKLVDTNERMAKAAEDEVMERRKQADALVKQSDLIKEVIDELRK